MALLKGFAVGIANIIPGVSGGTLALVLNIYERMVAGIKNFSFHTLISLFKALTFKRKHIDAMKRELKKADALFLFAVLLGIGIAFVAFSKLMTSLLSAQHDITYGFFFGLILASVVVPFTAIRHKNAKVLFSLIIGAAIVVLLCTLVPDEEKIANARLAQEIKSAAKTAAGGYDPIRLLMVLITGIVSTSSMILPGISGSFVSLLLGQYFFLLQAVSEANLIVLGIYAAGAVAGLKLFAKLMDYLFKRFHDVLMAFLTGLVVGSLYMTWPFKATAVVGGETLYLSNILPESFGVNEWLTLGAALLGVLIVAGMLLLAKRMNDRKKANIQ